MKKMNEKEALMKNNQKSWLSEVFNVAWHVQPITHTQLTCRFIIRIEASDMRLGSVQRWKTYDHERRFGCVEAMESGSFVRSN